MNTKSSIKTLVCVLRPAADTGHQWMNAAGRKDLVIGEQTLTGTFTEFEVRTGPSGSHVHTCYEPVATKRGVIARVLTCVLREVGNEGHQWVNAAGRTDLRVGERTATGTFSDFTAKCGPSGSHRVTCHQPLNTTEGVYGASVVAEEHEQLAA
jgi:hypothetical protein